MSLWSASIDTLPLPTRMANVAARMGLTTVGDLARQHPAALLLEKNLGRTTVADTRAVLERALGMRWEDAAGELASPDDDDTPASVSLDPAMLGWEGLAVLLPADLQARAPNEAPLPPRLISFAEARGIRTVGELVRVPRAELLAAPNLGRRTVTDATAGLIRLREAYTETGAVIDTEWKRLLVAAIGKLALRERMVLTQRAGLVGPMPTLAELGESLGVSRERVRQLEASAITELRAHAPWTTRLTAAIAERLPGLLLRLDAPGEQGAPLVADIEADLAPFRFLLEHVLGDAAGYVVDLFGAPCLSRVGAAELEAKVTRLERVCQALVFPLERRDLEVRLAAAADLTKEDVGALLGFVRGELHVEGERVTGYVERKADAVVAFLRAARGPQRVADVAAACGRGNWPEDLVWIDRGLVTLPELVPDFYVWRRRLGPLTARLMAEHGSARQWTTAELLPHLALVADLPEWMSPFALGSLLRDTNEVRYLGRNVVSLSENEAITREHIDETMEDELTKAGAPLAETELSARVSARRGVNDLAWNMMRTRRPFVLLEDGRMGLAPRDVPGGEAAIEQATQAIATWLEQRDEGAGVADTKLFLASLGEPIASWDARLLRSVLRHDGRFRLAPGGGLGLSAWGETRTKTQREVLAELLEAGGGRARVADVIAALPTASGEPPTRVKVGMLANQLGARLAGDYVVRWDDEAAGVPSLRAVPEGARTWVERVPEKAAGLFVKLLVAPRPCVALLPEVDAWEHAMRAHEGDAVDPAQVTRLAARARELLAVAQEEEGTPWATAARAGVEYLVCVEDGESDVVVGGLDDDEGVLATLWEAR